VTTIPQAPWKPMVDVPRDGSTVIVLAADFSTAFAFMWDEDNSCWWQFTEDWTNTKATAKYTYDEELDGYGWVQGPDQMHEDTSR
jgi:hypothetical protein